LQRGAVLQHPRSGYQYPGNYNKLLIALILSAGVGVDAC